MANILYFGENGSRSTSYHRAKALERLGHNVALYNPVEAINGVLAGTALAPLHFHTGYKLLQPSLENWLKNGLKYDKQPDLIWINSGHFFGIKCLKILRANKCPIILYNNDDPTGGRDGRRFDSLLRALPYYDLCAVLRNENISEYKELGAKNVIRVFMSYDEVIHKPFCDLDHIPENYKSEVAFIGTWMRYENRDKFILELVKQGVPVSVWGNRWEKSAYWKQIKPYYCGGALGGRDYVAAMQGAKICLGLLSKGNRDLHTRRSVEVPYAGGLLCAERTPEHQAMYEEGKEAVYWSNAKECAYICKKLLADDSLRESIRNAGMKKVRAMNVGNEDVCNQILKLGLSIKG